MKSAHTASVGLTAFDLFELIAYEHDIAHVFCFTINPRGSYKYLVTIARIAFKGQDLPDGAFCKVKPYIPPSRQCQNCWRFGHPAKYCRSTACCPLFASSDHTHLNCPSTKWICANCPIYKFELDIVVLHFRHDLTLKEARQEVHLSCFQ